MQVTVAARESKWALAATQGVINQARAGRPDVEFEVCKLLSPGDLGPGDLAKLGGTTSFVDALSRQVAVGRFDAAVHTVKDISWPSDVSNLPRGEVVAGGLRSTGDLVLAAITARPDPRDALVCREGEGLKEVLTRKGAKIGTSSLVRAAAFQNMFGEHGSVITPIRGNIDARLEKLDRGEFDLLILSMDGLLAVGQGARATEILSFDQMIPAMGQGLGAAEVRGDNRAVVEVLNAISDKESELCLRAEWALMRGLGVTCMTPIGGICTVNGVGGLTLRSKMYGSDGRSIECVLRSAEKEAPESLGHRVAETLHGMGASALTASWVGYPLALSQDAC